MSTTRTRTRPNKIVVGIVLSWATFASAPLGAETEGRTEVTVEVDPPEYDGFQQLLDYEARLAMGEGNYPRALRLFRRLLEIDPYDVRAMREAGRVAKAMGRLRQADRLLARADHLDGTAPDPELHFLRGETLHALGRDDAAERQFGHAERELGAGPHEVMPALWLARIAVLRGDTEAAIRRYQELLERPTLPADLADDIVMLEAEAYIQGGEWSSAEELLRDFLDLHPDHERGRALLAWALEGSGQLSEELALRERAAAERGQRPQKTLEYARALERAHDLPAALDRYREAHALGLVDAAEHVRRIERLRRPEIAGGLVLQMDPAGTIAGWRAGATAPILGSLRLAAQATSLASSGGVGVMVEERRSTAASAWALHTRPRGTLVAVGATMRLDEDRLRDGVGASAIVQTSPLRDAQLHVRGDVNLPWRESAATLRGDGEVDTLGAHLYLKSEVSDREVLASFGAQARRLGLDAAPMTRARQIFGYAGVDVMVTSDPARTVRTDSFDGEMLSPRSMSAASVISYRHYETSSDDPFGEQLVLVERSSLDELSGFVRHVDARGVLGAEVRGGLGYDWVRSARQWRAGGSLLFAVTRGARFTLDYDVASESRTGLVGRRHAGSVGLHVDL